MSVQGVQNVCHDLRVQQMRERKVESGEPANTPQTSQYSQTSRYSQTSQITKRTARPVSKMRERGVQNG